MDTGWRNESGSNQKSRQVERCRFEAGTGGAPRRRTLSFSRCRVLSPGTPQGRDGGSEGFSCCGSEGRHQRDITRVIVYSLSLNTMSFPSFSRAAVVRKFGVPIQIEEVPIPNAL